MIPHGRARSGHRALAAAAVACAWSAVPGCNIVAPAFLLVHGPPKTPALHELDPKRPTVVFVDDPANVVPRRSLRLVVAQSAQERLLGKGVLEDVIEAQAAQSAANADRNGKPLPITEVGRAVGAEVVVYARLDEFTLSADGQTYVPSVVMRVKVVDAVADRRIWPEDPAGEPIVVRIPAQQGDVPSTPTAWARAEEEMARFAGQTLAEAFYKHERNSTPSRPQ